jgi:hypothetical protein
VTRAECQISSYRVMSMTINALSKAFLAMHRHRFIAGSFASGESVALAANCHGIVLVLPPPGRHR